MCECDSKRGFKGEVRHVLAIHQKQKTVSFHHFQLNKKFSGDATSLFGLKLYSFLKKELEILSIVLVCCPPLGHTRSYNYCVSVHSVLETFKVDLHQEGRRRF